MRSRGCDCYAHARQAESILDGCVVITVHGTSIGAVQANAIAGESNEIRGGFAYIELVDEADTCSQ